MKRTKAFMAGAFIAFLVLSSIALGCGPGAPAGEREDLAATIAVQQTQIAQLATDTVPALSPPALRASRLYCRTRSRLSDFRTRSWIAAGWEWVPLGVDTHAHRAV